MLTSQILLKVIPDNRKTSFNSLFICLWQKIISPLATSAVLHKSDENFSGVLAPRIPSIQILFRIHVQSEDFLCRIRYFSVNGYFKSEENDSGEIWPSVNVALVTVLKLCYLWSFGPYDRYSCKGRLKNYTFTRWMFVELSSTVRVKYHWANLTLPWTADDKIALLLNPFSSILVWVLFSKSMSSKVLLAVLAESLSRTWRLNVLAQGFFKVRMKEAFKFSSKSSRYRGHSKTLEAGRWHVSEIRILWA